MNEYNCLKLESVTINGTENIKVVGLKWADAP